MNALLAMAPLVASSDDLGLLVLAGPAAGGATWWAIYRYYRNTDKSHDFERETRIESKPSSGNDVKFDEVHRTRRARVEGDNQSSHRERVQRVP